MNSKTLTLAGAVAAAVAAASFSAHAMAPKGKEACYGISMKGHNDCAAGAHSCAGQSSASYGGADFKYVPAGTCGKMMTHGHKGMLTPA